MKIGLLNVVNQNKSGSIDKDLAGGMGISSSLGTSLLAVFLSKIKQRYIQVPVLTFAYLQAILKIKGHEVDYFEGDTVPWKCDLVIIKGLIVDYRCEVEVCQKIKSNYPNTKVIFFGPFPSARPDLFSVADSVIVGDELNFFQNEFAVISDLPKIITVENRVNLDDLPTPDFTGFPVADFSYWPSLTRKPTFFLLASQGCPYSCSYYCAYGTFQGASYRERSPEKLIADIKSLKDKYHVKSVQFRDPLFGLNKVAVEKFCSLLIRNKLDIRFGIETRLDILNKEIIDLMFAAGLRNINVGVETINKNIASQNKRLLVASSHQEELIKYCQKIGVKVAAFYLFGLQGDTEESIKETIDYAIKLNTHMARFGTVCAYPGTKFYEELKNKGDLTEDDFEKFDSYNLVFKHNNLNVKQISSLLNLANNRFYLRLGFIINFIKWRIREFYL